MPESFHAIDFGTECGHINTERIEAAIFVPSVGEPRKCTICKKSTKIKRILGSPYWIDEEDLKRIAEQASKR